MSGSSYFPMHEGAKDRPMFEFYKVGNTWVKRVNEEPPPVDWEIDKDHDPGEDFEPVTSNKNGGGAE